MTHPVHQAFCSHTPSQYDRHFTMALLKNTNTDVLKALQQYCDTAPQFFKADEPAEGR